MTNNLKKCSKRELIEEIIRLRKLVDIRIRTLMPIDRKEYDNVIGEIVFFLSCRQYFLGKPKEGGKDYKQK